MPAENVITGMSDFSIFTAGMTIDETAPFERPIVRMVGSSTEQDLHRDTMAITALEDMVKRPAPGLLVWLNHDYTVPDSLFGSLCEPPKIVQHYGVADLHLAVDVELQSEAAAKTYQFIKNKRRLGCSIGFSIDDYELRDSGLPKGAPGWDVPLVYITHVRPVEWSVVGIPANQRSWIENAIAGLWEKSLRDASREEEAYRLAPVVKSLFPNKFRDTVRMLTKSGASADFVQYLKSVPSRPSTPERILWNPNTNSYFMAHGSSDNVVKQLDAQHVAGVMESLYAKAIGPHVPERPAYLLWDTKDGAVAPGAETKDADGVLDSTAGEPMNRQDLDEKKGAEDADKKAQEARSHKYHIGIKEGGNVTKPSEFASVPDSEWGDPTNYRYPMPDKSHADNAASRWGDASNRSQYSSEEQAIISRRIEGRQRHFGEGDSSDKKSASVNIISTETFENGSRLVKYDDGSEVIETFEMKDGVQTVMQMTVKAGQPKPDDGKKPADDDEKPGDDENDQEDDGDEDDKKPAKKKKAKKPDTAEDEDETAEDNADDKSADAKAGEADVTVSVVVSEGGADTTVVEQKSDEAPETAAVEAPVVEAAPAEEAPAEEAPVVEEAPETEESPVEAPAEEAPVVEQKSAVVTLDPAKELLLNSYNQLGAALGLPAFSFEAKAAKESGITSAVRSLAKVIDDAADELLRQLGVPDDDEAVEKGLDADTLAIVMKSGAEISARNKKRLQLAHDVLAEMSGGAHCAAYAARVSDAPAAMQREEDKKDAGEGSATKSIEVVIDGKAIAEQVTASFGAHVKGLTDSLSTIDVKALHADFEQMRTEAALARKSIEDLNARTDAVTEMLNELTDGRGLGRPTKTFLMRGAPQGSAAGVSGSTEPTTTLPEAQTLEEALAQTTVQYKHGVGMARKWAAGIGKGLRPSLTSDQMTGMTIQEITAYYDGGEALVPLID
ncbi:MAG: HK97 family phage prohead protease [Ktedonobacterales bacterium]